MVPALCSLVPTSLFHVLRKGGWLLLTSSLLPEVRHTSANLTAHFPWRWGRKVPTWLLCSQGWCHLKPILKKSQVERPSPAPYHSLHRTCKGTHMMEVQMFPFPGIETEGIGFLKKQRRKGNKNERHKAGMRKQNQSKERFFSTELAVKWRSLLPKKIANSAWFQDAFTHINKTKIHLGARHRLQWLGRQETDKEIFLLLPCIPFLWASDWPLSKDRDRPDILCSCIFYCRVAQVEVKKCICQRTKYGGKFYPKETGLSLSLLHKITWTSSFTSFPNTHPTHKTQQQWVCWGCGKHLLSPHCPPQPAHSPDRGHQQAHESFSCCSFIVGNCQLFVCRAKI